jgi:NAD(P)-dependent dehydrogenase (short-subunit alcohol dehydrogenase family)
MGGAYIRWELIVKTWFITGASRGFGRELTEQLLARGDRVAATLRKPDQLADLAAVHGDRLWVRALDVTDTAAMREVVDAAFAELGRGQMAFPGFSLYHTTKWGIEGFFEAFAPEVAPFGIRTTLVEPGMIRTSFYASVVRAPVSAAYADNPAVSRGEMPLTDMPGDQAKVVAAMIDVAELDDPPRRLLLGSDAYTLVRGALAERLAAVEAQRQLAHSTDGA